MNIQTIKVEQFPLIIITDSHCNLENIRKLQELYPKNEIISLGDITTLWKQREEFNKFSIDFFINSKICTLLGNHEDFILAVDKNDRNIISNVTNKNLQKYNLEKYHIDFLSSLPIGFKLDFLNGNYYLAFHNFPNDLWGFSDNITKEKFLDSYSVVCSNCIGVLVGHNHKSFIKTFEGIFTKLIGIGALKDKDYAILNEGGIQFKSL
jgi:hypothetical protein